MDYNICNPTPFCSLQKPGPAVKGIREISGHLQYKVAGVIKELELGFANLSAGTKAKELDAEIQSIKAGTDSEEVQSIELKLEIDPDSLKALYLVTGKSKTELKRRGYGGGGGSYAFTYISETKFSEDSRIVAEIYDQQQVFDVRFKLENISLLGEQLNVK